MDTSKTTAPTVSFLATIGLLSLGLSLIAGQLVRLPLSGQGGGLLLSDLAVVFCLVIGLHSLAHSPLALRRTLYFLPFIFWSLVTFLINASTYPLADSLIAFAYWIRLTSYLLLIPILVTYPKPRSLLYLTTISLSVLGLFQFLLLPTLNLSLSDRWDPHLGRLVSTWLDPNFLGAGLILGSAGAITFFLKPRILPASLVGIAILLTQSRSTFLALILTFILLVPFIATQLTRRFHFKLTIHFIAIILSLGLLSTYLLQDRFTQIFISDPTVELRLAALHITLPLALDNSLIGVGYNFYQHAALATGLIADFTTHSRAGADQSLLTIWTTTGLIGLLLFLLPWLIIFQEHAFRWFKHQHWPSLLVIFSFIFIFWHSLFVNSWLYAHLLILIALVFRLADD